MRPAKAIVLYAIAVIMLGALFAPWLFWTVQWLGGTTVPGSEWLAKQPFRRVFNRALLIIALVGLWPLLRAIGFRSWRDVGFAPAGNWWRHVFIGFVLALSSLVIAVGISVAIGSRSLASDRSVTDIGGAVLKYFFVGVVVSLIEETFFRGGLQGALHRCMNTTAALVIASAIYSALHFLKPGGFRIEPNAVTWLSGFDCLDSFVNRSLAAPNVFVGFVTLFLAGMILGWAFLKTRALYLSFGLHAGWVLPNEFVRWLGGGRIVEDMLAWPVLAALFALVVWLCRTKLKPMQ